MHQSQSRMGVADQERRVLEMSTRDALDHRILVVVPFPTLTWPYHFPWSPG
jgi:hypothetical protein